MSSSSETMLEDFKCKKVTLTFDDIYKKIGNWGTTGRWQLFVMLVLSYLSAPMGLSQFHVLYTQKTPDHSCHIESLNLAQSDVVKLAMQISTRDGCADNTNKTINYEQCKKKPIDWVNVCSQTNCSDFPATQNFLKSYTETKNISESCESVFYDSSVYPATIITEFDLACQDKKTRALPQSLYFVGCCVGALLCGWLGDTFGRRSTILIGTSVQAACMIATGFASSVWYYAIIRLLQAIGDYTTYVTSFTYVVEFVSSAERTYAGFIYGSLFAVGQLMAAGICWLLPNWRDSTQVFVFSLVPIMLFVVLFTYETVPFLHARGDLDKAAEALKYTADKNGKTHISKSNIKAMLERVEKENDDGSKQVTIYNLLSYSLEMTLMAGKVLLLWIGVDLCYYGISLSATSLGGNDFMNGSIFGVLEFFALLSFPFIIERKCIGRKVGCFLSFFIPALCFAVTIFIQRSCEVSPLGQSIVRYCFYTSKFINAGAYTLIYTWSGECFPTTFRNNILAAGVIAAKSSATMTPFILQMEQPQIVFFVVCVIMCVNTFFIPETLGRPILQTKEEAQDFYKSQGAATRVVKVGDDFDISGEFNLPSGGKAKMLLESGNSTSDENYDVTCMKSEF